jgi:hypothetical protein
VEKPLAQVEVLPKKELLKSKRNTSPVIREPKISQGATMQSEELKADTATRAIMEKNEGSSAFVDRNADVAVTSKVPANADTQEQIIEAGRSASSPALAEAQFNGKVVDTNNKALRSDAVVSQVDATKAKSNLKHLKKKQRMVQNQ